MNRIGVILTVMVLSGWLAPAVARDPEPFNSPVLHAISGDGKTLATLSSKEVGKVDVWNLAERKVVATLQTRQNASISSLALSRDGKLLAVGSESGPPLVWSLSAPDKPTTLPAGEKAQRWLKLVFSGDGQLLAGFAAESKSVFIWNPSKAERMAQFATADADIKLLEFAPTDTTLLAAFADETWQWIAGAESGKKIGEGLGAKAIDAQLSPDRLLIVARVPAGIGLWSTTPFKKHESLDAKGKSIRAVFHPNGKKVFVVRDGGVDLWRIDGKPDDASIERSFEGKATVACAVSPDGSHIAFADRQGTTIAVVPVNGNTRVESLGYDWWCSRDDESLIQSLAFSPDGNYLVAARGLGGLNVWQWQKGNLANACRVGPSITDLRFLSGGGTLVGHGQKGNLHVLNATALLKSVPYHRIQFSKDLYTGPGVKKVDCSPDGKWVAAALNDGRTALIDPSKRDYRMIKYSGFAMGFSRDSKNLCLISETSVGVYDLEIDSLKTVQGYPAKGTVEANERLIVGGWVTDAKSNSRLAVWDPKTGAVHAKLVPKDLPLTGRYAVSPDGLRFALLSQRGQDRKFGVEIFDVATEQFQSSMSPEIDSYCGMEFGPSGTELFIATAHRVVCVDFRRNKISREHVFEDLSVQDSRRKPIASDEISIDDSKLNSDLSNYMRFRYLSSMIVGANGLIAAGDDQGRISLIDSKTMTILRYVFLPPREVVSMSFSADGSWLAVGGHRDVHLFDLRGMKNPAKVEAKAVQPAVRAPEQALEAAQAKVERTLAPLLQDDDPHVRELAGRLLRELKNGLPRK